MAQTHASPGEEPCGATHVRSRARTIEDRTDASIHDLDSLGVLLGVPTVRGRRSERRCRSAMLELRSSGQDQVSGPCLGQAGTLVGVGGLRRAAPGKVLLRTGPWGA